MRIHYADADMTALELAATQIVLHVDPDGYTIAVGTALA
jgi:hypothetical protein